jgi:periplasmic protein TonB
MKNKTLYLLWAFICFNALFINTLSAQLPVVEVNVNSLPKFLINDKGDTTFLQVDIVPEFPEGQLAMFKFLANNIRYPRSSREEGAEGTAYIYFIVNTDGTIQDVTEKFFSKPPVTSSRDKRRAAKIPELAFKDLATEAMRVVKLMPNWKPGILNGNPVKVAYTLPIKFKLG